MSDLTVTLSPQMVAPMIEALQKVASGQAARAGISGVFRVALQPGGAVALELFNLPAVEPAK